MSLPNLKTKENITLDRDYVGGSRILPTAIYDLTIKVAYLSQSKGGAWAINIIAETPEKQTVNQQFWMTSGTEKGCLNVYKDKEGNEQYLPGFVSANSLALLTLGKEIGDLDVEEKVINLYNFEQKKEVPTKVQMYVDLVGTEVKAAVEEQLVDKNVKNDAGKYVPSGETRSVNEIDKFYRMRDSMTVTEIQAQAEEAAYYIIWSEKNKGQIRDKSTKSPGVTSGAPAAAAKSGASEVKSLFA